ncbi:MAG: hypothetical protein ACOCVN_02825 [bacterium]
MSKSFLLLLIIFVIPAFTPALPAEVSANDDYPALKEPEYSDDSNKIDIPILIYGGGGLTINTSLGYWDNRFSPGPALSLGAEFQIGHQGWLAFELNYLQWFSKLKDTSFHRQRYADMEYNKIVSDIYSNNSLSANFKFYILNPWKFRISTYIGLLLYQDHKHNGPINFGFGISYIINDQSNIGLNMRTNIGRIDFGGNSDDGPNILCLEFQYYIY